VWINANAHLFRFFREEPFLSFTRGKYHFNLMPWVPKARLINRSRQPWTHHFRWGDEKELKEKLTVEGTSRMVMVVSNKKSEKYRFPMQHRKKDLDRAPFLKLENTLALKNKTVYFYKVL
jgi:hypothetical protein